MATAHIADITLDRDWVDLVSVEAGAGNANIIIQNHGAGNVYIVSGGESAPTNESGIILVAFDSVQVRAAHIWAKASGPSTIALMGV